MYKNIVAIVAVFLLPTVVLGYTVGWTYNPATNGISPYPTSTTTPTLDHLVATSTTATSTFAGNVNLQRYTLCGPSSPWLQTPLNVGLECWGNDNTINGWQMGIGNRNAGASAYTGFFLNNDQAADGLVDNYGFLGYNSSAYNDSTFGTGTNVKNLLFLQNSDGPLTFETSSTTAANSYISFNTGGSASSNEAMRIIASGKVGIATTTVGSTPTCTLCVNGTTYSTGWNFFGVSPTGVTGTGGNIVLSSGGATFNGNAVSMPIVRGGTAVGSTHTIEATTNVTPNSSSAVIFAYGASAGSESARMVGTTGFWGFGTTSPFWNVTIASSTGPQMGLGDGSGGNAWTFRTISNALYIATSTALSTSTTPTLMINSAGQFGFATSSPNTDFTINGKTYINGKMGFNEANPTTLFSNTSVAMTDTNGGSIGSTGFTWSNVGNVGGANYVMGVRNPGAAAGGRNGLLVQTAATDNASFPLRVESGLSTPVAVFTAAGNLGLSTTTPAATLHVFGSQAAKYTDTATSYTVATTSDYIISITSTASTRTVTLPYCNATSTAVTTGIEYIVKDASGAAATNNITVQGVVGQPIDGASTKVINTNYGVARVFCDPTSAVSSWMTY